MFSVMIFIIKLTFNVSVETFEIVAKPSKY